MVGSLALARVIPLLLLSLFGGVVADQADRRKVMFLSQSGMALVSLALFLGTFFKASALWPIYALIAVNAVARSFDGPARQAMMVNLVPREDFPNAASLNGIIWRLSDVLGPVIMGVLIALPLKGALSGLSLCYLLNFLTFAVLLFTLTGLPDSKPQTNNDRPQNFREILVQIKEGWNAVQQNAVVRHSLWIDFWATFFSGAEALYAAFVKDVLHLDSQAYGLLASSTGVGAMLAAAYLAWRPTVHRQGRLVILMIASYGVFTVLFGLSPNLPVAMICLAGVGASDMISTVMRQTIRQLATPDALRGRMNATCSLFHISGPQLGDYEAGWMGKILSIPMAIVIGGVMSVGVAAHWSRAKALSGYVHEPEEKP